MVQRARIKRDIDFIARIFKVIEGFRVQGQPYLVYLKSVSRPSGDEYLIRDNLIKPLFVELGYDPQKDFVPEETIKSGRADLVIRDRNHRPVIVIETLHTQSPKQKWGEHRRRLLGYARDLHTRLSVLSDGATIEVFSKDGHRFVDLDLPRLYRIYLNQGIDGLSDDDFEHLLYLRLLTPEHQAIIEEDLLISPELDVSESSVFNELLRELGEDMRLIKEEALAQFDAYAKGYAAWLASKERYRERLFPSIERKAKPAIQWFKAFNEWARASGVRISVVRLSGSEIQFQVEYPKEARDKFCIETMYVLVNRVLLMRISEDKEIIRRCISNGGITHWLDWKGYTKLAGINYSQLLRDSYDIMQRVYPHLYRSDVFDWFQPSSGTALDLLFTFNRYNFSGVDRDVLGKLYERYLNPSERKRLGQFYTPEEVIDYILGLVGYTPGDEIEGKRLLDPACGSGGFLIRALWALRERLSKRGFDPETILRKIQESLYGFDINPFACHIAETNLVFQVIDLVREVQSQSPEFRLERFNIFTTDSLKSPEAIEPELFAELPSDYLMDAETVSKIKQRAGEFADGFDFIVGNPPYVKARDPGEVFAHYRKELERSGRFKTLYHMWDIYVPFIELGYELLKDGGRFGFIVSDSFEKSKYATLIRKLLIEKTKILEVSFFKNARLFEEASVHNVIFGFEKGIPSRDHPVRRVLHEGRVGKSRSLDTLRQLEHGESIFRSDYSPEALGFDLTNTVDLCQICYTSYGLRLNADERFWRGEFKKADLLSDEQDEIHSKRYIEGKDIERYCIKRVKFMEWGTGRVPRKLVRPTFLELYTGEKLLLSQISAISPRATFDDTGLICEQTIIVANPWKNLFKIKNNSIKREIKRIEIEYNLSGNVNTLLKSLAENSKKFNLKYILAIINSTIMIEYLKGIRRSKRHILPNDYKRIPIKIASPSVQKRIADQVDRLIRLNEEIPELEALRKNIPELTKKWEIPTGDLADISGVELHFEERIGKPKVWRDGRVVHIDRKSYLRCNSAALTYYLELYLNSIASVLPGKTQSDLIRLIRVPKIRESVNKFLNQYRKLLTQIEIKRRKSQALDRTIDRQISRLYGVQIR